MIPPVNEGAEGPKAAATLADVARVAGVNKVTASVVMNGRGQGNTLVSEATRLRVQKAAEALYYQPNAVSQSLRHGRTHCIGFYLPGYLDTRDLFLSQILSGLHGACAAHRRDLLLHGAFSSESVDDVFAELRNGKVDGLVIFVPHDNLLAARLAASHLPTIAVANPETGMASVTVDDVGGARLQAEHLYRMGHRVVLY
ncbi:MAG: LacI family DNA-binding transcriptional regulator, partial [Armatimonadota bacterium]